MALSRADNELMCRVGKGTGMGTALRRFWIPALQSSELPVGADAPVSVEVLGEKLVAFRDEKGQAGILNEACCHRGASLTLGRVESCGLRCIYHGWLFATDGEVLETPNVADPRFKTRFKAKSYPVREAGGLIWTYLGDAEQPPAFPDLPWLSAPDRERLNACAIVNCNYVQVMEGLFDSSHLTILHASGLAKTAGMDADFAKKTTHMQFDASPRLEAEETDFGFHYAAMRNVKGKIEARVAAFISPLFVLNPNGDLCQVVVPMSDERTAFYHIWWDGKNAFGEEPMRSVQANFVGLDDATLETFGMTRATCDSAKAPSRANGWRQDRAAMRAGHFTGVTSFIQEDAIVTASGGAIRDRSEEHLSTADVGIAHLYRALLRNARAASEGKDPAAIDQKIAFVRGASAQIEEGGDWKTLVPENRNRSRSAA